MIAFANGMFNDLGAAQDSLIAVRALNDDDALDAHGNVFYELAYNHDEDTWTQLLQVVRQKALEDPAYLWRLLAGQDALPPWFTDTWAGLAREAAAVAEYAADEDLQRQLAMYLNHLVVGHRVLIVSHSQGNFYANSAALLLRAKYRTSVGNVQVATPAKVVETGGPWNTFSDDVPMFAVRKLVGALPANLPGSGAGIPPAGDPLAHSFLKAYLRLASDKIATDMVAVLASLAYPNAFVACEPSAKASSSGDPHVRTLDGLRYDQQSAGDFDLVRVSDSRQPVRIMARQEPLSSEQCPHVTLNTALGAQAASKRVAIYADREPALYIDGAPVSLVDGAAQPLSASESVAGWLNHWELRLGVEATVAVDRRPWRSKYLLDIHISPDPAWRGRTRGLLGDFDGIADNDLLPATGTSLAQPAAWDDVRTVFVAGYRVPAAESFFDTSAPLTPVGLENEPALAQSLPPALLGDAEAVCAATGIADDSLQRACVLDVVCSGGDTAQAEWIKAEIGLSTPAQIGYATAFSAPHCTSLVPKGRVAFERLTLPVDGTTVSSLRPLALGVRYSIRVSGTFEKIASAETADAEYARDAVTGVERDACSDGRDLGVEVMPSGLDKVQRWGTSCASHSYTSDFIGRGESLALRYDDCSFADNAGSLTVDIYEAASPHPVTTDLMVNGSFESSSLASGPGPYVALGTGSSILTGWSVTQPVDYVGTYWQAFDGNRSIDMNSVAAGVLSQMIATVPDQTYWVFFGFAGNVTGAPQIKLLRVSAGETEQTFRFDITGHSYANMGWSSRAFSFTAKDATTTLTFTSLIGGPEGPVLDWVRAVPEPD